MFERLAKLIEKEDETIKKIIETNKEKKVKSRQNELKKRLLTEEPHLFYYELQIADKEGIDLRPDWIRYIIDDKKNVLVFNEPTNKFWTLIKEPKIDLKILPEYSFFLTITFELSKPFISRGDEEFNIIENSISREKIFNLPYMKASSWKGSLRSALWQIGYKEDNEQIIRIFGNEREEETHKNLKKGRTYFYPTFFNKSSLEVINPHDRETRTGKNPIYFESVPINTEGVFSLLYIPYDGTNEITKIKKQVKEDLLLICKGIKEMLVAYGFGAKTSSGFGSIKPDLTKGKLSIKKGKEKMFKRVEELDLSENEVNDLIEITEEERIVK